MKAGIGSRERDRKAKSAIACLLSLFPAPYSLPFGYNHFRLPLVHPGMAIPEASYIAGPQTLLLLKRPASFDSSSSSSAMIKLFPMSLFVFFTQI
jgi:hypothetical protein